ncbi:CotO family spore coat protein [Bacillus sp. JJ664]
MARKESHEGVKPLLYIAQPDLEEAKLNIQHSYVVKVNKQEKKAKKKDYVESHYEEVEDVEEVKEIEEVEEIEDTQEELESSENKVREDKGWVKKPFKAMTNEEKVYFMVNKPHYIPKVECRIRTKNDLYIGYILAYNEGKVAVKITSSINNIEIPLEEIVSIQMVGI